MKALVLEKPDSYPGLREFKLKEETGKVKIQLTASALNHRDVWITKGLYPGIQYPVILGSDGVGQWQGKRVVLNPGHEWGQTESFQGPSFNILGLPSNGTFAEEVYVHEKYIHEAPEHLSDVEAAALPLAGLTAFRALRSKANAKPGERVLITGIGGGVALFALQFAIAMGLEAYVSSGSIQKINSAKKLGAIEGVNYNGDNWDRQLAEICPDGFDVVIDGAGGSGVGDILKVCNPGARMIIYGGTRGKTGSLNTQQLFWKQISIMGTTMGSEKDFSEMLQFVSTHHIKPVVDSVYRFDESNEAFQKMDRMTQFGKIVFQNT